MDDPELQEIFTDPAHQEVVDLLKSSRPSTEAPLDPHFRSYLRAKLMTEAQKTLPRRRRASASARPPWFSLLNFKPRTLTLSMAAVAAGFLVVLGVQIYLRGGSSPTQPQTIQVVAAVNNQTNVPTEVKPIVLNFSGPVDKNAVAESVQIEPATSVTKQWVGSSLVITPEHPLAPNTTYTVRLKPSAIVPTSGPSAAATPKTNPTPAPTPVVVHFTTVRAPAPAVVPPSFRANNITYGADNRLADSGTILNAVWTSSGQILATRPAGQLGPGQSVTPSASAAASASPAASPAGTDVWLLSPDGASVRNVAPGATLPSAPATGNLFAAWTISGGQSRLDVRDLQGDEIGTVATINSVPDRPASWLGNTRLAYIDSGVLKVVDLQGNPVATPTIQVARGSIEASPNGTLLAVESQNGSVLVDLTSATASPSPLPNGATSFDWSARGDLAFLLPAKNRTDLYVALGGHNWKKVASSADGQTWSDANWSPDAASLLLATHSTGQSGSAPGLLVINSDGSDATTFGAPQNEYSAPEWSPSGNLVLFTRHDEATGGITFQVATVSTTGVNQPEQQALSEVDTFMKARMKGDASAAQAELDSNGQAAYQNGNAMLLASNGTTFDRYYPVTVQLAGTSPSKFLIGVRTFIAKPGGTETSYFEEQLTVVQQGQRYVIDGATSTTSHPLDGGPSVVSIEVLQSPPGQQVRVRFDADLKADTVNNSTIEIKDESGTVLPAQVTFDPDNHLAVLTVKLQHGTYQLVVTTGVTDVNDMALPQEYDAPLVISR